MIYVRQSLLDDLHPFPFKFVIFLLSQPKLKRNGKLFYRRFSMSGYKTVLNFNPSENVIINFKEVKNYSE